MSFPFISSSSRYVVVNPLIFPFLGRVLLAPAMVECCHRRSVHLHGDFDIVRNQVFDVFVGDVIIGGVPIPLNASAIVPISGAAAGKGCCSYSSVHFIPMEDEAESPLPNAPQML